MYVVNVDECDIAQVLYDLFDVDRHELDRYWIGNSGEIYSDFEEVCHVNFEKALQKEIYLKATHVTRSGEYCKSIKEIGLLNLQQAVTQPCELYSFLAEHDIKIDLTNQEIHYNQQIIKLASDITISANEWIYHKLYIDYFVNGFLNENKPLEYSVVRDYPEFIDKLDERLKLDTDSLLELKILWRERCSPYLIEFHFPLEQLHTEFYTSRYERIELTGEELELCRLRCLFIFYIMS